MTSDFRKNWAENCEIDWCWDLGYVAEWCWADAWAYDISGPITATSDCGEVSTRLESAYPKCEDSI